MNRFGLLLFLLVALGLAGGTPAEGRRVLRRARVDVGHPELEVEQPAGPAALAVAPRHLATAAALPGSAERPRRLPAVRVAADAVSSGIPAGPAVVVARSRAPPLLG